MLRNRGFQCVVTALGLATAAYAQPTADVDAGVLTSGSTRTGTVTGISSSARVKWVKFTLPTAINRANGDYLDIDTNGGTLTGTDSMIGLYDSTGAKITSNDDNGPSSYSMLSFGAILPNRAGLAPTGNATSAGDPHAGSAGATLAAGTYWLAITGFSSTFNATNWSVTTSHTRTGDVAFVMTYFFNVSPTPPTGVGAFATSSTHNCGDGTALATVQVNPGANPTSTGITVTGDFSSIGGAAAQPMYDDGTNGDVTAGDGRYSYLVTVGASTPPGTPSCPFTVADAQNRSSTGTMSGLTVVACPAPPPANDICAGAFPIAVPSHTLGYTTSRSANATTPACSTSITGPAAYYMLMGTGNTITVNTCDTASTFDTKLTVYCAVDGCGGLTCVGANDDDSTCSLNGLRSRVSFCSVNGAPYLVMVHGYLANTGTFGLNVLDDGVPCTPTVACGQPTPPTGVGSASPATVANCGDQSTLLSVLVTPGAFPPSTGISVRADIRALGGSESQDFYDDGTHGDATANDNRFSYSQLVSTSIAPGNYTLPFRIDDASGRSSIGNFGVAVNDICPPVDPWAETDDAGDVPGTAQIPVGSGTLTGITGTFSGGATEADMYLIEICDPASFRATTTSFTSADTQLFLFHADGTGVAMDDDEVGGTSLQSTLTNAFVTTPGNYYLAVSRYDADPVDASAVELWLDSPFRSERVPDGAAAANPVAGWVSTLTLTAPYVISLRGTCYPSLCPPCAADYNQDGGVDGADVEVFYADWENGLNCADVNADGGVDGADVEVFFASWENGDPTCGG